MFQFLSRILIKNEDVQSSLNENQIKKFDAWRGLLGLIVCISHVFQIFIAPIIGNDNYLISIISLLSHFSVLGFFGLSGILIIRSLFLNYFNNDFKIDIKKFVISRYARIYPVFLFSILLCFIFKYIIVHFEMNGSLIHPFKLANDKYVARENFIFSISDVILNIKMTGAYLANVNGPLWSLVIEWWLYFLGLSLFLIFAKKSKIGIRIIGLFLLYYSVNNIIQNHSFQYIYIWYIGALFFYFLCKKINIKKYFLIISLLTVVLIEFKFQIIYSKKDPSQNLWFQISLTMLFLSIVFSIITSKVLLFFSKISYTLYIIHFPIFLFLFSIFYSLIINSLTLSVIISLFAISLSVIIAYYSSFFFENKKIFINFLNKII
jgi:peptidoglycan/LPS O-acetylase OafA/YrhL